ncbi:MAG TPA: hypothetical protein VFG68_22250 [Fimbriiglobus sp.]|nr:hypothetical protein [Fimbriiglobus sp.]
MPPMLEGLAAALAYLVVVFPPGPPADMPDLSKVDRSLKAEPVYVTEQPLYGLAVFGPKAEARVWMVLDKTKPDADSYDVLHVDLDADGDLTGKGERLTRGKDDRFHVGDYKDPATGAEHAAFSIRVAIEAKPKTVMLSLRWRGQFKLGGGYPVDPEAGYMQFAQKPADAPVLWVHGDGPFRFQRWYGAKLTVGGADDFKVFLGQPGRGPSTFCAAQEHILPKEEYVKATLVYRDGMGKEQRLVCELKERC